MLPQAYVYPAEMRATRDLLRRRMHLARKRGALLAHVHNTNSQYHLPAIGKKIGTFQKRAKVVNSLPSDTLDIAGCRHNPAP